MRKPLVIVKKVTEPAGDATTSFSFASNLPQTAAGDGGKAIAAGGGFSLKDGEQVSTLVDPGQYSITEADGYALGYRLKSASCAKNGERAPAAADRPKASQSDRDRTVVLQADAGDTVTCTFVNEKLNGLQVVAKTPKEQSVYIDQDASYRYEVTNTGTLGPARRDGRRRQVPRPGRCARPTRSATTTTLLEPGEKWVYTCKVAASQIFTGDITKVTNTVTVNAK